MTPRGRRVLPILALLVGCWAAPADAALVAGYALDERAGTVTADVTGAHPATLSGGATWVDGHAAAGVQFDGTTGTLTVAHTAALSLATTGTIEAWVRLTALGRWHGIIAKGTANSTASHTYALEINSTNSVICNIGTREAFGGAMTASVWTHLACTWDGTTLRAYKDGVQVGASAQGGAGPANTAPVTIGRYGGPADWMAGAVDDVRLYDAALTAAQIQADMATPVGPGGAPVSWPNPGFTLRLDRETGPGTLRLDWTDNATDEEGIRIERRPAGGTFAQIAELAVPNLISFTDGTLVMGQSYCYRVRAYNAGGHSGYSNEACGVAR